MIALLIQIDYLPHLDVLRIHGSLLAIGELILTLSEPEISADTDFYQVLSSFCLLIRISNPV